MRERSKQFAEPGTIAATVDVERGAYRVQRLADGRIRVTVEYGSVIVCHTGTPFAVRARLASDTPAFATAIGTDVTDIVEGRLVTQARGVTS
jgi:hypothetical protein